MDFIRKIVSAIVYLVFAAAIIAAFVLTCILALFLCAIGFPVILIVALIWAIRG